MRNKPSAHMLAKNKTIKYPQYFCFVDTETTQDKKDEKLEHKLKLGVCKLVRFRKDYQTITINTIKFRDTAEFWKYAVAFITGKNTLHIIAHNAVFDMTILQHIEYLSSYGYECEFVFEEGVTFISKWKNKDKRIMILDNSNWFKGKLEKWGKQLGTEKLAMPDYAEDEEKWFIYCERDVQILVDLQKWYIRFIIDNDLGTWKYTIAGQAFNAYRHRFMEYPIYIPGQSPETEVARKSYHGGRTEVFRKGEFKGEQLYYLDINSMYPYVMLNNLYPTAVEGLADNPPIGSLYELGEKYSAIGLFSISIDLPYFPYIHNNHTIYPVGEFTTYLTTPEILVGLKHGWLRECLKLVVYRQRPIFTSYVKYFYNKKQQAVGQDNNLLATFYKLFLNSLYGKFGQRGYDDRVIGEAELYSVPTSYGFDAVTGDKYILRQVGKNVIKSSRGNEAYNAFTAIASHVTAFARIYLYELILRAGISNTFYCDTDSLIVNAMGYNNLIPLLHPTELGKLKVEKTSNNVEIVAPKHYRFGDTWTRKGIRNNAQEIRKNTYRQEIWPGFNKILQYGGNKYYNYFVEKTLKGEIYSGQLDNEGFVHPFEIKE
jgi:hypothetical protein